MSSESTGGGGDLVRRVEPAGGEPRRGDRGQPRGAGRRHRALDRARGGRGGGAASASHQAACCRLTSGRRPRHGAAGCPRVHHGGRDVVHHMLRAAEVSPRGAVQPLVRLRSMLRADARVSLLPRASDDVARPAPRVISGGRW